MQNSTRRQFLNATLGGATTLAGASLIASRGSAEPVAVVGGGPAGINAALGLRLAHPHRQVVLLERDPTRMAQVEGTRRPFARPNSGVELKRLRDAGVDLMLDDVRHVDWAAQRLELISGRRVSFGTLVMAPGVAPKSEAIPGYHPRTRHAWPAAWGNAREARRLEQQLSALSPDGHVVLRLPADAGGYPQIAAKRALAIAAYLNRTRPAARLTVLDGGEKSMARTYFEDHREAPGAKPVAWYTSTSGGTVLSVNADLGQIETTAGRLCADVVNFIVPQGAAPVARLAGLSDASGWCPVDAKGWSTVRPQAVVIGDACKVEGRSMTSASQSGRKIALTV